MPKPDELQRWLDRKVEPDAAMAESHVSTSLKLILPAPELLIFADTKFDRAVEFQGALTMARHCPRCWASW